MPSRIEQMLYSLFSDFLVDHLIVSTPGDKIMVAREMFEKYEIEIYDKKLLGELVNFLW